MEMFNRKELDKRIGPLKKNKKLYDLEAIEGYVIRKASPYILAYFLKKLEKKVRNKFTQNNHKDFNYSSKKTATKKEKVGEYVDFEEID